MNHFFLVAVIKRLRHVQHVARPLLLAEGPPAQVLVQLPPRGELEDEVDSPFVVKVAEQSQNIPVPERNKPKEDRTAQKVLGQNKTKIVKKNITKIIKSS